MGLLEVEALTFSLDNRLTDGGEVVSQDSWYSFMLAAESTPGAIVRVEGLGQLKNPTTLSGIEPVTFRLVA
jgi:hypothetical protein